MARGQLRGVAGHTYLVAKNLLVLFLKLVEKMKVCIVLDNFYVLFKF